MDAPSTLPSRRGETGDAVTLDALLLPVDDDWYALDMIAVREVVTAPVVTDLPTAPGAVIGVFNLRGDIVPLLDTAALLGVGRLQSCAFAAVVDSPLGLAGLATTGVLEAVGLGDPRGPGELDAVSASYVVDSRVVALINLETLLDPANVSGAV